MFQSTPGNEAGRNGGFRHLRNSRDEGFNPRPAMKPGETSWSRPAMKPGETSHT